MSGTIEDRGGSGGVLLAACQLILATCQKARERQDASSTQGKYGRRLYCDHVIKCFVTFRDKAFQSHDHNTGGDHTCPVSRNVSQYWQVANVAGKMLNLGKVPVRSTAHAMRGGLLHVYYIHSWQLVSPIFPINLKILTL